MANPHLLFKTPGAKFSSVSAIIFDLDCRQILSKTPLDPQIGLQRQKICPLSELSALGLSRATLEAELISDGMDPASLSDFASLELHVARLTPHSRFPPHFHFLTHELYYGLQGMGLMRIGLPVQNGKVIKTRAELNPTSPLSCRWSQARTKPFPPGSIFLVKAGEVHALTNDASSELITAFICSNNHLDDAKDRVKLPDVK